MAAIHDLLAQVQDDALRARLEQEVNRLTKTKKFGLVFEEHIPECTPLYDVPIRRGATVAKKSGKISEVYEVALIRDGVATCVSRATEQQEMIAVDDLVAVAQFGDPIYPYLKPIDTVCNAPDGDLWHTLIEADNYHALQLLEYLYAGKVDCIYIDPPYNTGAKDWKYNNDYVDSVDSYRHSKWLSMMEKRLKVARRVLNPQNSVLIVTIDEKEYLHLGCLLEEMFPEAKMQMVSTMINPAGGARANEFGRMGEYIFFLMFGDAAPLRLRLSREWVSSRGRTHTGNIRWDLLKRSGSVGAGRSSSPGCFYPIYINEDSGKIEEIGESLPDGVSTATEIPGTVALLPIRDDGSEGRWQWSIEKLRKGIQQGRVKIGGNKQRGFTVYVLKDGEYAKVEKGEFEVIGNGVNGEILVADIDTDYVMAVPSDQWRISSHDATQYGARLLLKIFDGKRFAYPKPELFMAVNS